jgi:uncharacterized membrane protein YdjX (TVP38/TMEM64 family)
LFDLITQIIDTVITWCSSNPLYLFLAIVFLPGFGFPASPLLILAGLVWGSKWQACLVAIFAMSLNMSWTYAVAAGPARGLLNRILRSPHFQRFKISDPSSSRIQNPKSKISPPSLLHRFTVLMRITPGMPFFLQNYVLGLIGVPFLPYILISVPLNAIWVIGFVLTGGAIFEGNVGMIAAGLAILIAAAIGLKLLRSKLASRA